MCTPVAAVQISPFFTRAASKVPPISGMLFESLSYECTDTEPLRTLLNTVICSRASCVSSVPWQQLVLKFTHPWMIMKWYLLPCRDLEQCHLEPATTTSGPDNAYGLRKTTGRILPGILVRLLPRRIHNTAWVECSGQCDRIR